MKILIIILFLYSLVLSADEDIYTIILRDSTFKMGEVKTSGVYTIIIDNNHKALILDSSMILDKDLYLNNFKKTELGVAFLAPCLYNIFLGYQRNRYRARAIFGLSMEGGRINGVKEKFGLFTNDIRFDLFPELAAQLEFAYQFNNSYNSKNYITAYFGVGRDILLEENFRKDTYYVGLGYSHKYKYLDLATYLSYRVFTRGSDSFGINPVSSKNIGFGMRIGFFVDIF
jgi:hypothetical protein